MNGGFPPCSFYSRRHLPWVWSSGQGQVLFLPHSPAAPGRSWLQAGARCQATGAGFGVCRCTVPESSLPGQEAVQLAVKPGRTQGTGKEGAPGGGSLPVLSSALGEPRGQWGGRAHARGLLLQLCVQLLASCRLVSAGL